MNEEVSKIVIDLVKELADLLNHIDRKWTKGYFRFLYEPGHYGCNGSYTTEEGTLLIRTLKYSAFFDAITQISLKIFEAIEKPIGLLLLILDSDLNYDIKFEWHDLGRWRITKLDGATGIPAGL